MHYFRKLFRHFSVVGLHFFLIFQLIFLYKSLIYTESMPTSFNKLPDLDKIRKISRRNTKSKRIIKNARLNFKSIKKNLSLNSYIIYLLKKKTNTNNKQYLKTSFRSFTLLSGYLLVFVSSKKALAYASGPALT